MTVASPGSAGSEGTTKNERLDITPKGRGGRVKRHVLNADGINWGSPRKARVGAALTEAGAAESFAAAQGHDVRFDHRRGRWLVWHDHRFVPDVDGAVTRLALKHVRQQQHRALDVRDGVERQKEIDHWAKFDRRAMLDNLLAFAKVLPPIADTGDQWDANPWLLGCPNGVIDLKTGTLRAGRREDNITMSAAVPFDPAATCPRWEAFLADIFNGAQDLIEFLRRAIGYSVTGITTEQCLFLLYGTGSNGKGTFANTINHVLGDYGWNMPFSTIELRNRAAIPNDLAALVGRRFVIASETNDGVRLNEARVKALTGCDPITARFLHAEFFTFEPVAKFWLSVNHKPVVRDDSHGFWRRLRLIPFTQRFDLDPTFADKLQSEAVGIFAWAIRGCLEEQQCGLRPPAVVMTATQDYERESDVLADFIAEACELEPESEVGATELFQHYKQWADRRGLGIHERLTATVLGRKLGERFLGRHTRHGKVYIGIARRTL
jgi:putative DNA primase/helicase